MSLIHLVLPSGDVAASGNRGAYTIPLSNPLQLDNSSEWEVAMVSASFPHPGNGYSVFISCSLCDYSRVGSVMSQLLFRVAPSNTQALARAIQDSVIVYMPISGNVFNSITVNLTYANNLPIPAALLPADDFSTVDIIIRKVR